jgi:hypothetical protein
MTTTGTLRRYCTCGAAITASGRPQASVDALVRLWDVFHTGAGHAPCTQREAARARRREDELSRLERVS